MTLDSRSQSSQQCRVCEITYPIEFYYLADNGKPERRCKKCRNKQNKQYVKGTGRFGKDSTYAQLLKKQILTDPDLEYELRTFRPVLYNRTQKP